MEQIEAHVSFRSSRIKKYYLQQNMTRSSVGGRRAFSVETRPLIQHRLTAVLPRGQLRPSSLRNWDALRPSRRRNRSRKVTASE